MNTPESNSIYNDLIQEMVDNRKNLSGILDKVSNFRNNIEKMIPTSNEFPPI